MTALFKIVQDDRELYALLDDEQDIPQDQLYAILEASDEAVNEKAARVVAFIKQLQSDSEALSAVAKGYKARADILDRKAESLKAYLRMCMEGAKADKLGTLEHSVKLLAARASVVVDDISLLPSECKRVKEEADKTAIKNAIESGFEIKGAHIEYKAGIKIS